MEYPINQTTNQSVNQPRRLLHYCPQAVDPLPFLRTVKDLDGNPIDVSVQQDAQGFLLDLFDKLEVLWHVRRTSTKL